MTEIMDRIESSLALAGYDIVDVKDNTILFRDAAQDKRYRLSVDEEAE